MPGPVPKRSDQRHGHRTQAELGRVTKASAGPVAEMPPGDEEWHPIALDWYESLARSGQAQFYEASDWATARLIAESMSRDLSPQFVGIAEKSGEAVHETIPLKGASLSAYLRAMAVLMVTEGDRRRLRLELERSAIDTGAEEDAVIAEMAEFRRRAAGA